MNLSYPVIVVPAVHLRLSFICFSNDKLGSGPYRAIIHCHPVAHDLVTSMGTRDPEKWLQRWCDDSDGKYKCWDGKLSAHTSRLGLYGSPTAARGWEQLSSLSAQRGRENLDSSQVSQAHFRINLYSMWICLSFVLVAVLHHNWMNQIHYSLKKHTSPYFFTDI